MQNIIPKCVDNGSELDTQLAHGFYYRRDQEDALQGKHRFLDALIQNSPSLERPSEFRPYVDFLYYLRINNIDNELSELLKLKINYIAGNLAMNKSIDSRTTIMLLSLGYGQYITINDTLTNIMECNCCSHCGKIKNRRGSSYNIFAESYRFAYEKNGLPVELHGKESYHDLYKKFNDTVMLYFKNKERKDDPYSKRINPSYYSEVSIKSL